MLRWTVHLKGAPNRGNNHSAVAVGNNRIYYFGQDPKRNTMKQMGVYIFNAVSLRWTKLRPVRSKRRGHHAVESAVPSVRRGHTVVLVDEVALVWGGIPYCETVYAFDVARHASAKPAVVGAVPEAWQHHSAVALGAVMYVFGGETVATRCTDDMHRLDTVDMRWSLVRCGGERPLVSAYHSATVIGSRMFVFGGWGGRGVDYNNIRVFDAETDCWLSAPEKCSEQPEARQLLSEGRLAPRAFALGGELYIFGGWNCNQTLSDLWRFSPAEGSWARLEPKGAVVPKKPWMCCCVVGGGGGGGNRVVLFKDDLHVLDLSPSLKTLCELAVVGHRLDQSGLPHNVRWELAAMRKTRARRRTRNAADGGGGCVGVRHGP